MSKWPRQSLSVTFTFGSAEGTVDPSPVTTSCAAMGADAAAPKVLPVYRAYTRQSLTVAEAPAERGCVRQAAIESTWWFRSNTPIRSFLKSDAAGRLLGGKRFAAFAVYGRYWSINLRAVKRLGVRQGGEYIDGIHFSFAGRPGRWH